LWCGGGHLHRECPENTNTESTPGCWNRTLAEGEKPHSASLRGCSHAKGKLQRRRERQAPKGSSGKAFFSKFTSPQQFYATALPQDTQQQQPQAPQTEGKSVRHHNRKFREKVCQYRRPVRPTMIL
jgi:hypothetical protein